MTHHLDQFQINFWVVRILCKPIWETLNLSDFGVEHVNERFIPNTESRH